MKGVVAAIFFFLVSSLCVTAKLATPIERDSRMKQLNAAVKLHEACQYVPHKDLCIYRLINVPWPGTPLTKLTGMVVVLNALASSNATTIKGIVLDMYEAYHGEETEAIPEAKGVLKCYDLYDNAIGKLNNSSSVVINSSSAVIEVKKLVNEAIAYSNSCDQLLTSNLDKARMGTRSQVFRQLCENTIAIVNIIAEEIYN